MDEQIRAAEGPEELLILDEVSFEAVVDFGVDQGHWVVEGLELIEVDSRRLIRRVKEDAEEQGLAVGLVVDEVLVGEILDIQIAYFA